MRLHYGKLVECDIANGVGVRVSLFVSGCRNYCPHCFQPETWDFQHGTLYTAQTEEVIHNALHKPYIRGLTILGGEPMEPENQRCLVSLVRSIKTEFQDSKDIWCYTGYTLEQLTHAQTPCQCEVTTELLSYIDVLVDGRYEEKRKDLTLRFRGSSNQRVLDVKQSLRTGSTVAWKGETWF